MKSYLLIFFLGGCLSYACFSQNSTISIREDDDLIEDLQSNYLFLNKQIVVVPYTEKLYRSEIDSKFAFANPDLSIQKIRASIEKSCLRSLTAQLKEKGAHLPIDPYVSFTDSIDALWTFYKHLDYVWVDKQSVKQAEEKQTLLGKAKNVFNIQKQEPLNGIQTTTDQGQLKELKINANKFMSSKIDPQGMSEIQSTYKGVEGWLVINQLDILHTYQKDKPFIINLHYTFFNKHGKNKSSSIQSATFDESALEINTFYDFIHQYLAEQLIKSLSI